MTLDQAIEQAAQEGRLHFSFMPASQGYQANLSVDGRSWRVEMGPDPVTALRKVFGIIPGAAGQLRQPTPATTSGAFD